MLSRSSRPSPLPLIGLLLLLVGSPPGIAEEPPADPVARLTRSMATAKQALAQNELQIAESRYRTVLLEGWLLVGALAVEAARYTTAQMRDIGFGNLESMMIETPDSILYLAGAKGNLLTLICSGTVNLGSLKMKLSTLLPRLAD